MTNFNYHNEAIGAEYEVHRLLLRNKVGRKSFGRVVYAIKPCTYSKLLCKLINRALSKSFKISRERVSHYFKGVNDGHLRKELFSKKDEGDVDVLLIPKGIDFDSRVRCVNIKLHSYEVNTGDIMSAPDFHTGSYYDFMEKSLDRALAEISDKYIAPIVDFFTD